MWKVLVPEPAHRKEQATQILEWCVQDEEKMVAEALTKEKRGSARRRLTGLWGRCIAATERPATSNCPHGHE
jgi:hypothetical protein